MTDPSLWRELASDLPAALRDFACIVLFVAGVVALAYGLAGLDLIGRGGW